jgi:tetratricopeptide (TPR) repeat protein
VERAIALDPQLAEAYASRGLIRYRYVYDWAGAEGDFRRAVELNPGYALAHVWYGYVLTQQEDRPAEAIRVARRAAELDPLSPEVLNGYSFMLFNARQYPASEEQARELLDLAPSARGHQRLAEAYLFQGRFDEAIREFQTTLTFLKGRGRRGVILARMGFAYARGGRRAEALRILQDLKRDMASGDAGLIGIEFHLAILCAGLGDKDQAFSWLEQAFHERDFALNSLATSAFFDSLRPDPRFQQLLRKLGGDA